MNLMSPLRIQYNTDLFNGDKDKTSPIPGSSAYRIPCSCGRFYIGRTQKQFGETLSEHRSSIDKAMGLRQRPKIFRFHLGSTFGRQSTPFHFI